MIPKRKSPFAGFRSLLLQYFNFTVSERKGIFQLMAFMFLLVIVLYYFKFTDPKSNTDFEKLDHAVIQYNALYASALPNKNFISDTLASDTIKKNTAHIELFTFNPNKLADSVWTKLGLSERQIRTIKNYENKGGAFYSKADVKKMYCISEEEYIRLESYIDLPDTRTPFKNDSTYKQIKKPENEKKAVQIAPLEINIANEEDLITIPGIGPGRASAIIKYRAQLGGYIEMEQVKEAYGMDSVYDAIKKYLLLGIYTTRRMNINTNSVSDLKHPYITSTLANIIINYRKAHGDYTDVNDLRKLEIVDEKLFKKLSPYLKVK
jgi:competence protein ComEA